jgi:predicted enzyme related to lactoylglutathione lyase
MNPFQQHGAFSWSELITSDVDSAREFYGQLLGWKFKEGPMGGIPYTVVEVDGKEVGGMTKTPEDQPGMQPTWGVYITVEDVKKTAENAKELGGKVLIPPMNVETVGEFTLIQDPQGATFCAIAYG